MKYRPLGATGLQVSEIVFGAGAVGAGVFRGAREERLETVRRALAAGINWIDTAPGYGDGQSEENLGWILPELAARVYVSTKVRLASDDLDDIAGAVERSIESSLARLGRSSVDVLQLHNPVGQVGDPQQDRLGVADVLGSGGVADALDRVRDKGLVSFVGFTAALGEVDALHELVASGRFQTAQVYHNVLNPSATMKVPKGFSAVDYREIAVVARERGIGVLNIRVLAAGVIGGAPPGRWAMSPGSEPERDAERAAAVVKAMAREPGTPAQKAIRFALDRPANSGVLVGFSNATQVDEAVAAVDLPELSQPTMARLAELYATDFGPG